LDLRTSSKFADVVQAEAAGYLEAAMTPSFIENWLLSNPTIYPAATSIDSDVVDWLNKNVAWMTSMIAKNPADVYWQQVNLIMLQMSGMMKGYNAYPGSTIKKISFLDVFAVNAQNSISDITVALSVTVNLAREQAAKTLARNVTAWLERRVGTVQGSKCSTLVRFVPNADELYVTHDTWSSFGQMLRILKSYSFAYSNVPNTQIKFTSYPATLWSGDDFYQMNDLAVVETTGEVYDLMLWYFLTEQSVLTFARTMIANRLATSGASWANIAKQYNSGT
jgi:hypothetical protein